MASPSMPFPKPFYKKIEMTPETRAGKVNPYIYQTPCKNCGCQLVEGNSWQKMVWKWNSDLAVVKEVWSLLCSKCARKKLKKK